MSSDIDWQWQKLQFEKTLSEVDGDAFEAEFQKTAKSAWHADFTPAIPMGSRGDLKCDGYKHSTKTVFQCYGPRYGQADTARAVAKVQTDFPGAADHWKAEMSRWVFVTNLYNNRVPPEITRAVAQCGTTLRLPYEIWGRDELVKLANSIDPTTRIERWGKAPRSGDMVRVTYEYIGRALALVRLKDGDGIGGARVVMTHRSTHTESRASLLRKHSLRICLASMLSWFETFTRQRLS